MPLVRIYGISEFFRLCAPMAIRVSIVGLWYFWPAIILDVLAKNFTNRVGMILFHWAINDLDGNR